MSTTQTITDPLASLVAADVQRVGAALAQDVFSQVFRHAVNAEDTDELAAQAAWQQGIQRWLDEGDSQGARTARLAFLVYALDAWGLAYTQAFRLQAIPPLTALLGSLRTRLDPQAEAQFAQHFAALSTQETAAIDGKIALRRSIHLALWHAMAACSAAEESTPIVQALGGLMLALDAQMPENGWRLLADSMATLQMALLEQGNAARAQEGTQQLFAALQHALPTERYQAALNLSSQALMGWMQARRAATE